MHKLRAVYDRLYIAGETVVKAHQDRLFLRAVAPARHHDATLERFYRDEVRPYWRQYSVRTPAKKWFYYYCASDDQMFSPRYIPDTLWHRHIIPYFNDLIHAKAWQDKCLQNRLVPELRRPVTVVKNIAGVFYDDALHMLTEDEAAVRCLGRGRLLAKPSLASGGSSGIRFFESGSLTEQDVREIFRLYRRDYLIQEKAVQHEILESLHPGSLNTIRALTFLWRGEVRLLYAILRVGGADSEVDSDTHGGWQALIGPDGHLRPTIWTHAHGRAEYRRALPDGTPLWDIAVPSFGRVVQAVRSEAARMARFPIIGWDIGVAPDGEPLLVEFNLVPAMDQESAGPIFGELTDDVLTEVFGRRKRLGETL